PGRVEERVRVGPPTGLLQQRGQVAAVDRTVPRHVRPAGLRQGGEQVHHHHRLLLHTLTRDLARPADNARDADAALERRPLAELEWPGRALRLLRIELWVTRHRAVVAKEDDQRVVVEVQLL